ncbi:MAG: 3-dehydroquinate synthase, partial [Myxococcales bacterium]|nr:3-dehydroquinate synthase [Myxococcales bacterium]
TRVEASAEDRPLLAQGMDALLAQRRRVYAAVDKRVDAEGRVDEVADRVRAETAGVYRLEARVGDTTSRILVGRGLTAAVAGAVAHLEPERPALLVLDQGVPEGIRSALTLAVADVVGVVPVTVPGGEQVKTWASAGQLLETALAAGCGRQSVVLAVGGGATCDLGGLVAHLLGRGAPLVLVPTTLLAQVDASVGGKCALNMPAGRNLVGAFHPATDVVADLDALASLDEAEHRSGLAELLKMGIIGDAELFARVAGGAPVGPAEIARAVQLKAEVVAEDPFERGRRRVLNLGHTLGHALETASGHALRHGEAVAIGIAAVARLSLARGWAEPADVEHILRGLTAVGLPTTAEPGLLTKALDHVGADKKSAAGQVALVAIQSLASVVVQTLSLDEVRAGLLRYGGDR